MSEALYREQFGYALEQADDDGLAIADDSNSLPLQRAVCMGNLNTRRSTTGYIARRCTSVDSAVGVEASVELEDGVGYVVAVGVGDGDESDEFAGSAGGVAAVGFDLEFELSVAVWVSSVKWIMQIQSAPGPLSATFGPPRSQVADAAVEAMVTPGWPRMTACCTYRLAKVGARAFSTLDRVMSVVPQDASRATLVSAATVPRRRLAIGFIFNLR
jgi:hypothetical protein